MPELPEVELVSRALARHCQGRRIVAAKLLRPGLAPETAPAKFARILKGATFARFGRRGKHILAEFDNDWVLVTHLRMTGRFLLLTEKAPLPKHTHALFSLDDQRRLVFTDQRHFGLMKLVEKTALAEARELRALAPEPFSPEFDDPYLRATLKGTNRALKEALLDQRRVTGLGNIYAAEAMFLAGINPRARASQLSSARVARLRSAIIRVLTESLSHGSTMNVDPEEMEVSYYSGPYNGRWHVYDREGEPCRACRAAIRRITQGGRSTYFCPRCQRR